MARIRPTVASVCWWLSTRKKKPLFPCLLDEEGVSLPRCELVGDVCQLTPVAPMAPWDGSPISHQGSGSGSWAAAWISAIGPAGGGHLGRLPGHLGCHLGRLLRHLGYHLGRLPEPLGCHLGRLSGHLVCHLGKAGCPPGSKSKLMTVAPWCRQATTTRSSLSACWRLH